MTLFDGHKAGSEIVPHDNQLIELQLVTVADFERLGRGLDVDSN